MNQNLNANITVFRHLNANDRTFVNKVVISSEKVFANETIGSERKKNPDFNSLVQKYEYKDMTYIYIQLSWSLGYRNISMNIKM